MDFELLKTRLISFIYQIATAVAVLIFGALLNFFGGPDFEALVTSTFGNTFTGTIILMAVTQVVAHLRNTIVLGRAKKLGARGESAPFTII